MAGIPSMKQIIAERGEYYIGKKCPKCGSELIEYDGGDQGGLDFIYCENNRCKYEKR